MLFMYYRRGSSKVLLNTYTIYNVKQKKTAEAFSNLSIQIIQLRR